MRPVLARGQNDKGFSSGANKAWRARNRVHRLPETITTRGMYLRYDEQRNR